MNGNVTRQVLVNLMKRYEPLGMIQGHGPSAELLLRPADAVRLIDDLAGLGVAVTGADGWQEIDARRGEAQELMGVYFGVAHSVLRGEAAVRKSAALVKQWIEHGLPPDADYVDVGLDIPYEWDVVGVP